MYRDHLHEMRRKQRNRQTAISLAVAIPLLCLFGVAFYNLPPVHDRLAWRVEASVSRLKYALNPPEEAVFVPQGGVNAIVEATLRAMLTPTVTPEPTQAATPSLAVAIPNTSAPTSTPPPTLTPAPLPGNAALSGVVHEYQMWNNCGPANLAMALSFWGWSKDQRETAAFLKPNTRDKNVMPYEMADFVREKTDFGVIVRSGGDLEMIKAFVASGFPVIVEKGFEGVSFDGWMGHYEVVTGYDDAAQALTVQDSYNGPDESVSYEDLASQWRAFNYLYIVIYPAERQGQVRGILGPQFDETENYRYAAQKAQEEIPSSNGRDLFFALYNRGTSLVALKDYAGAAQAFDAAFANYPLIPEKERPWRMLWYQTGPYFAYFYTQRYQDVINLADTTLKASSEPVLEESFYWRGRAEAALGDAEAAITDYRRSAKAHPGFQPALDELQALGAAP